MRSVMALGLWFPLALGAQATGPDSAIDIAKDHFESLIGRGSARAGGFAEISDSGTYTATFGVARPDSLWRAASTTKALTALAILRLEETGRLDLDSDVNRYLKHFQVPGAAEAVITIRDLLGHQSGLDDPFVGTAYLSGEQPALTEVMGNRIPQRVFEPGEARLYSNYAYGILGAVIEEVTGQSYAAFLQREVLGPIGMKSSTFLQPLPRALEQRVVGTIERSVFGFVRPAPILYHRSVSGGGLTATLDDLATFARFIQNNAVITGSMFVSPDRLASALGQTPNSPGYGFGFGRNRGQRYWYAGGDLGGYHTVVLWFPEHRRAMVAVAASYSAMSTWGLVPKVMEKWFGEPRLAAGEVIDNGQRAPVQSMDVAGTYRPVRYPHNDLAKIFTISMDQPLNRNADHVLTFQGGRWRAVERLRFRNVASNEFLSFSWTEKGQLLLNREFERIPWYATGYVATAGYFGFLFGSVLTTWLCRNRDELRYLRWTAVAIASHSVLWLGAVLLADPQWLILGLPWYVAATTSMGWLCLPPWLLLVGKSAVALAGRRVRCMRGLTLCLGSLGFGLYLPFLWYWRIV